MGSPWKVTAKLYIMKKLFALFGLIVLGFSVYAQEPVTQAATVQDTVLLEESSALDSVARELSLPELVTAEPAQYQMKAISDADGRNDDGSIEKYRRSSLYSILITHSSVPYAEEIKTAFLGIPTPEKFNNHDLPYRILESSAPKMRQGVGKKKTKTNLMDINNFFMQEQIAKQMMGKWFNRNAYTGAFDMGLIQERGFYDASQTDIDAAAQTSRNIAMLGDAGEELIGKTFVLVNDVTYVDKGKGSAVAGSIFSVLGSVVESVTGISGLSDVGDLMGQAVNEIDGFTINITSYLFRLDWNEEIMGTFYKEYWYTADNIDEDKKTAFDASDLFTLSYIGETFASADNLSSKSFSKDTKEQQMLKVCARCVDKAIVNLQKEYDEFKVNVPIYRINEDEKTVEVQVGLKEGISEKSDFEVLMKSIGEDGKIKYNRVGTIRPVKGKIWDNRYGALEDAEAAAEANKKYDAAGGDVSLNATTFEIITGGNRIGPGCLVREVKFKK